MTPLVIMILTLWFWVPTDRGEILVPMFGWVEPAIKP